MPYNGELRELYNDIDKRVAVDAKERDIWRKSHDDRADKRHEETTQYRTNMYRLVEKINDKLEMLPCRQHQTELRWLSNSIRILAIVCGAVGSAIIGFMVTVHMGG